MLPSLVSGAGLLLALPCLSNAAALVEQMGQAPEGWEMMGYADPTHPIHLQLALTERNTEKMISELYAVSDPNSPRYGQYYEREDVEKLVKPSEESNEAVLKWLKSAGVRKLHSDGTWVTFQTTVGHANRLLDANFLNFENNGVRKMRTMEYSIPDDVVPHVDFITPTVFLGNNAPHTPTFTRPEHVEVSKRQVAASCQTSITPSCLKQLYNIGNYVPDPSSGAVVAFGSFLNQSALHSDLFKYEKRFGIPKQDFDVTLINGATNDQNPKTAQVGEADLDVQNIVGVSHPLPVREFITGGSPPFVPNLDEPNATANQNEPYLPYYQYLIAQDNKALPQVISNSYGDDEQTVPIKYATRVCNLIGQLGMRGISVLESSGDTGVGAPCQSNDGKKTPQFTPQFPGTCPFITAVGGTQAVTPEVAWRNGSGGFSNYFAQPSYQKAAVNTYLTQHVSPATLKYQSQFFNKSGRGFPDISAHSLRPDYQVIYAGVVSPSGGTSAAAPVWAAIIGLLNDARFRRNLPALGFLNPWLYSEGYKYLTDITEGGSVGCTGVNAQTGQPIKGASVIPYASWNATQGWDPVTGLGTPNFGKLLDALGNATGFPMNFTATLDGGSPTALMTAMATATTAAASPALSPGSQGFALLSPYVLVSLATALVLGGLPLLWLSGLRL